MSELCPSRQRHLLARPVGILEERISDLGFESRNDILPVDNVEFSGPVGGIVSNRPLHIRVFFVVQSIDGQFARIEPPDVPLVRFGVRRCLSVSFLGPDLHFQKHRPAWVVGQRIPAGMVLTGMILKPPPYMPAVCAHIHSGRRTITRNGSHTKTDT